MSNLLENIFYVLCFQFIKISCFVAQHVVYLLNVPCELEKNVKPAVVGCAPLIMFKSSIFLLMFGCSLNQLSLNMILNLPISIFNYAKFCFMYVEAILLG